MDNVKFHQADAEKLSLEDSTIDVAMVNGIFNLNPRRNEIFSELARVVRPGGKVILAEFHKHTSWIMRLISRAYFSFFEPFALDMWGRFNPSALITSDEKNSWTIEQESFFHDNFQVVSATKGGG